MNGVEHFHHYVFGCEFTVQTDHQPLVNLTSKTPFGSAPLMQCLRSNDHDHECRFDPQDGDFCYARLDPMENVWEKGFLVRKVI